MAFTLMTTGLVVLSQYAVNRDQPEDLVLKLFKNNATISAATVLADLTEADFTGYSAVTLTGASWTGTGASQSYTQQTFQSSADQAQQDIYGAFMVRATGGELIAAEKFSAALPFLNNGDNVKISPQITAQQGS